MPSYIGHDRPATGCDRDTLGLVFAAGNLERVRVKETGAALNMGYAALVEVVAVNSVQALYVGITAGLERTPVMPFDNDIKPVVRRMVQLVRMMRCIPHDLFRHASNIDTGPAQRTIFDDRCFRAVFRRALRMSQSAAAAADHQQVKFVRHIFLRR